MIVLIVPEKKKQDSSEAGNIVDTGETHTKAIGEHIAGDRCRPRFGEHLRHQMILYYINRPSKNVILE